MRYWTVRTIIASTTLLLAAYLGLSPAKKKEGEMTGDRSKLGICFSFISLWSYIEVSSFRTS